MSEHLTRRRRWGLNFALLIGWCLSAAAFAVEFGRARHGHLVAWIYVIEWPLLGTGGTYLWWSLTHPDRSHSKPRKTGRAPEIPADDPDLLKWQAYVAQRQRGSDDQ